LPTRGWELAIGALIAFYFSRHRNHELCKKKSQLGSLLGLVMVLYAIFAFNKSTPFPSFYALVPTLGAALLILFATPNTWVGKVFATKMFVGMGLISYSAYLWHQPLLVFARHLSLDEPSPLILIIMCISSIILAYCSWRFVERPFRTKGRFSRNQIFFCAIVGSMAFFMVGLFGHLKVGGAAKIHWVEGGEAPKEFGGIVRDGVECSYRDPLKACRIGSHFSDIRVVIAGDSHARVLTEAASHFAGKGLFELVDLSASGCPFLLGMTAYVNGIASDRCNSDYQSQRLKLLSSLPPSFVILHSRFPLYINGKGFDNTIGGVEHRDEYVMAYDSNTSINVRYKQQVESFEKTVRSLRELNHKVVIVAGVPANGWNPIMRLNRIEQLSLGRSHEQRNELMRIPLSAVLEEQ
jgi:hypothetical protein